MPSNKKTIIDISSLTLLKVLLIIMAVAFLFYIRDIVMLVFIALILASALNPFVDYLESKKLPRAVGTMLVYFVSLGILVISVYLLIIPLRTEIGNLANDMPMYWQKLTFGWHEIEVFSQSHGLQQNITNAISSIQSGITAMASNIFGGALSFIGSVASIFVVLVMTFYLIVYDKLMKRKVRSYLPVKYQPYFTHLVGRMQEKIGLWLRGQLLLSFIIFAFSLFGLLILGVKYAWVLALFAGVTEIIPYLGPFIGAVPAVFIAFTISPLLGIFTLILYIVIQQAENYLIVPQVMKRSVGLNPVIVIVAIMIGAQVAGIAGIILAVPVTTALGVVVGDILQHRQSGFSKIDKTVED